VLCGVDHYNGLMRIIAGAFRRRVLKTPPDGSVTRPIPDRVKESLFQLLRGHYEGATVFDAFSGTGAIGLEAVSRGAVKCVMVEKDRRIANQCPSNCQTLPLATRKCATAVANGFVIATKAG
jgi:16S rRNA (guanine966-N2)-methyltransferase